MSGLIWVQTVCKDQQQTKKFAAGRQRGKLHDTQIFHVLDGINQRCSSLATCDGLCVDI